jgi:hypothetical protein
MGKKSKKLAFCATEKIELDLTSCWAEADSIQEYSKPTVKTIALSKTPDIKIKNRIGDFFKEYNLIAYGFNNESLNIDVVFLLNGYACLCKTDIITNNAKNITICLVSKNMPKELLQELRDAEIIVEKQSQGIYYFQYMFTFQIVVLEELAKKEKTWLKTLTSN